MHEHIRRRVLPVAAGLTIALIAAGAAGAVQHEPWQPATAVTAVNGPAAEGCPIESPDGNHLFIASTRGAGGEQDIWVASRDDADEPFGEPVELPAPVNSTADEFCPTPLRGNWLLFVSNRTATDAYGTTHCGGGDMYVTRRSPATGLWSAPRNLGCASSGGPNGPGIEYGPSLVETDAGAQLYFSSGGAVGAGTQDIYVSSRRSDGTFGSRSLVMELNTAADDAMPNVRKDGLEIVFTSNRPGSVLAPTGVPSLDVWSSSRASVSDPWGPPVNLGAAVNTGAGETRPSLSWKADRLYFGRAGDIFVSTR